MRRQRWIGYIRIHQLVIDAGITVVQYFMSSSKVLTIYVTVTVQWGAQSLIEESECTTIPSVGPTL